MKILIIRNAFIYDFGGAERLAVHMAQELKLNKIESVVVSRQPRLLDYAKEQGVTAYRGWWWSKQNWSGISLLLLPAYIVWQVLLVIWYLRLIGKLDVDAVHALSKDDFIAATVAARLCGKKVMWSDPADLKYVYLNHGVWYKNPVGKVVYAASKFVSYIILMSHNEKHLIETSLGRALPAKYLVIHTAGKDEKVVPAKRTKQDMKAIIFSVTSRLVVAKGIGELIEAFNKLSKGTDAYRLWLMGDGPDEAKFKQAAGGNPHIVFFGHVPKALTRVAASDVFVQPTYNEAFSLSIAEAAMLGKPMIVTRVGGNPELVNDKNGVLVPVKDSDALCKAMQRLADNAALRRRMGEQARSDYTNNFDFSHIMKEKYVPLYEEIVKN